MENLHRAKRGYKEQSNGWKLEMCVCNQEKCATQTRQCCMNTCVCVCFVPWLHIYHSVHIKNPRDQRCHMKKKTKAPLRKVTADMSCINDGECVTNGSNKRVDSMACFLKIIAFFISRL